MARHHAFPVIFKSRNSLLINYLLLTLKWVTAYTVSGWFLTSKQVTIKIRVFWHATLCQCLLACYTVSLGNRPDVLKNHSVFILRNKLLELHDHENECTNNYQNARITCPLTQHHTSENLNPQKYQCNDLKCCMSNGNEHEFAKETSSNSAWGATCVKCKHKVIPAQAIKANGETIISTRIQIW